MAEAGRRVSEGLRVHRNRLRVNGALRIRRLVMAARTPDFYVVKRARVVDGKSVVEWLDVQDNWTLTPDRYRYLSSESAHEDARAHGARVVPVYCTTKRVEPKMRERSSAWVLKRLAEGKVVLIARVALGIGFVRLNSKTCQVDYRRAADGTWMSGIQLATNGTILCRVAKDSEVPK